MLSGNLLFPIVLAACLASSQVLADAKSLAEQIVARSGMSLGYDENAGTIVFIGTSQRHVADLLDSRAVMKLREEEAKVGMLKAKAEILKCLARDVSSTSVAKKAILDGSSVSETSSVVEILSHLVLHGFQTICTAESYENGIFQTAVAIGWSEKAERTAREALSGSALTADSAMTGEGASEWKRWADKQDFSAMVVSRSFEDSHGIRRYVGIGFADIDGKTGAVLKPAMTRAFTKAKQNLLYALHSDAEARNLAMQFIRTRTSDEEPDVTETFRSSSRRISQECKSILLPKCGMPVFETTALHPITGRRIYVCLAGIEPRDLAEIKAFGQ